ncbi:putative surface protein with fasciclin (FAS1) repeats [Inquilinus ginsengisoli]|uniref:Surface protein with fasciclin (FAS1) repeats n=1 Tax=Inquilinus ginsengisoli TaxID=363840 RepID=A0ABU1JV84_9PROT|nr:fasciclin domain-containing protein [Inquilinus ginsengisoli]MDR6292535.1 putative surface protein with fasciclin (FAS1) repeats [Inquilinus ginsengisoli]
MKSAMKASVCAVALAGLFAIAGCSGKMTNPASATTTEKTVTVGGAPMYPSKTIVENAVNSADHTTLVAAVKAAGLVDTLNSPGPFTVFAPTNAAFDKLPAGTVDTLVMPKNKKLLTSILTYHVVPGRYDSAALQGLITQGGGWAKLPTADGKHMLTVKPAMGGGIEMVDEKGGVSMVTIADVTQSNGVIHVVDTVLMPKK